MSTENYDAYFNANKDGWNKRTAVHKDSSFYNLERFKAGHSTLNPIELEALGDVKGKSLLHLQCHFGLDTMSWSRLGAIATGVDFSNEAISLAQEINDELKLNTTFIQSNIYDLKNVLKDPPSEGFREALFDIVFTSYGVIGWLPDLDNWAAVISHFLKPGGTFFMAEFHPVVWMMDENFEHIKYHYHNQEVIEEETSGTYTDRSAPITYKEYSWNHSLSEVMNALISHGLTIQSFNEYPFSYYNCFNKTVAGNDGLFRIEGIENKIPMMFSIKANKQYQL